MGKESDNQIQQWLKKLEQESWQLELLVSAFTIFLLIGAITSYSDFLKGITYEYDLSQSILSLVYVFLVLLNLSIQVLTVFLVVHLLLRGFWIGSIGLRSVQSNIHFDRLNYSDYFTEKIKKKVISLDSLVILLDEICSLIFSFAFLMMSILVAFGLYLLFLGIAGFTLGSLTQLLPDSFSTAMGIFGFVIFMVILLTGIIYFIDYVTLGFFKKFKWFSKIYYPIYRFYGFITLAVISRSIYYYLISRFSKKRIRIAYLILGILILFTSIAEYDQYQYFPGSSNSLVMEANVYDDARPVEDYIVKASISSRIVSGPYFPLFLRYAPGDNEKIQSNCPELIPVKEDGFNWRLSVETSGDNFIINSRDYSDEDQESLMDCLRAFYQISISNSDFSPKSFYFYTHPSKGQKGLLTMIPTENLPKGEQLLKIEKVSISPEDTVLLEDFVIIPFWVE